MTGMTWDPSTIAPCACGQIPRPEFTAFAEGGWAIAFTCKCGQTSGLFRPGEGGAPLAIAAWNALHGTAP